ncbi:MAG: radical SAM family heme chaperone HemW [Chloroflexota bacterium]
MTNLLPRSSPSPTAEGTALASSLSLYVHIPFCEVRCPYCDFNTYAGIDALIPPYMQALRREIRLWGDALDRPEVRTVFFGGGTPSYVPSDELAAVCRGAWEAFRVSPDAEVTMEANPGDFSRRDLSAYLDAGVNRLSIGVQSLDDGLLESLGRKHDAAQAVEAYEMARAAGFDNISLDLMFGLPGQSMGQWQDSVRRVLDMGPEHLSLYGLTLEPGTPMEAAVRRGQIAEPDSDLAADMFLYAMEALDSAGYRHYEVSNWALPGMESRHNLAYWRNKPYLGVGPGAHSYLPGVRFANLKSPRWYIRRLAGETSQSSSRAVDHAAAVDAFRAPGIVDSVEDVTPQTELADTVMMGMRLMEGLSEDAFRERFGVGIGELFGDTLHELVAEGLVEFDSAGARLTRDGILLGNEVFECMVSHAMATYTGHHG